MGISAVSRAENNTRTEPLNASKEHVEQSENPISFKDLKTPSSRSEPKPKAIKATGQLSILSHRKSLVTACCLTIFFALHRNKSPFQARECFWIVLLAATFFMYIATASEMTDAILDIHTIDARIEILKKKRLILQKKLLIPQEQKKESVKSIEPKKESVKSIEPKKEIPNSNDRSIKEEVAKVVRLVAASMIFSFLVADLPLYYLEKSYKGAKLISGVGWALSNAFTLLSCLDLVISSRLRTPLRDELKRLFRRQLLEAHTRLERIFS